MADDTGPFSYPVNGKIIREYIKNKTDGIDISAPEGTPILAAERVLLLQSLPILKKCR